MAANAGAWRHQDTVVLAKWHREVKEPHPQWRWRNRAPEEWQDCNVRRIWREAEPLDPEEAAGHGGIVRYHEPSGMALLAEWGVLQTVVERWQLSERLG